MEEWWATRNGRQAHVWANAKSARDEDKGQDHLWVYCSACDEAYVTRRGAIGCSCGRLSLHRVTRDTGELLRYGTKKL